MAKKIIHTIECDRCGKASATQKRAEAPGMHISRADVADEKGKLRQVSDLYICSTCLTGDAPLKELGSAVDKALAGRR